MAPVVYSGALQPKKKAELQEIANALRISDHGTKEELQNRIKKHLDHNPDLEDEPAFAGLFGRKRRSVQPPSIPPSRFAPPDPRPTSKRRNVTALDPIVESTPQGDLRNVSIMLKSNPFSPEGHHSPTASISESHRALVAGTPSSLPPLPPSPSRSSAVEVVSPARSILQRVQPEHIVDLVRNQERTVIRTSSNALLGLRSYLSNAANIWYLTAVFELLSILYTVIPWKFAELPLSPSSGGSSKFFLPYPPLISFQSPIFWKVILHWSIPTVVIPGICGILISFTSMPHALSPDDHLSGLPSMPFDPLTASIIRLAAQIAYPFPTMDVQSTQGIDVLGSRWRVLDAAVGVALAFAEAITQRPAPVSSDHHDTGDHHEPIAGAPKRKALMGSESPNEL